MSHAKNELVMLIDVADPEVRKASDGREVVIARILVVDGNAKSRWCHLKFLMDESAELVLSSTGRHDARQNVIPRFDIDPEVTEFYRNTAFQPFHGEPPEYGLDVEETPMGNTLKTTDNGSTDKLLDYASRYGIARAVAELLLSTIRTEVLVGTPDRRRLVESALSHALKLRELDPEDKFIAGLVQSFEKVAKELSLGQTLAEFAAPLLPLTRTVVMSDLVAEPKFPAKEVPTAATAPGAPRQSLKVVCEEGCVDEF